jgi:hypothetical protein
MARRVNGRVPGNGRRSPRGRKIGVGAGLRVAQDPRYAGARDAGHRHGAIGHASAFIAAARCDAGHRHGANAHDQLPDLYRTRGPGPMETNIG